MLPPPHWSPTGNSGTWIWDEQGEVNPRTDEARACWRFHDDVYGRVVSELANDYTFASNHIVSWDASATEAGIYFIYIIVNGEVIGNQKVVLTK